MTRDEFVRAFAKLRSTGAVVDVEAMDPEKRLRLQQAFGDRVRRLRERMRDLVRCGDAEETEFDPAFERVEARWNEGVWEGERAESAFFAVEQVFDLVEDRVALRESARLERIRVRDAFSERMTGLRERALSLEGADTVPSGHFAGPIGDVEAAWREDRVDGEGAEQVLDALRVAVESAEERAGVQKLYGLERHSAEQRRAVLLEDPCSPVGALDPVDEALRRAAPAASGHLWTEAVEAVRLGASALTGAERRTKEERYILENYDTLVANLIARNELGITRTRLEEVTSESELSELVRLERDATADKNERRRKGKRRVIRDRFQEIVAAWTLANQPEPEEPEEEDDTPETEEERAERLDGLKRRYKSTQSLLTLSEEGEIFRIYLVFANRGQNRKVGVGSSKDFCSGYEVHLKDGPKRAGGQPIRYRPMIVHFHFSDRTFTTLERAHFKDRHGGDDKSHVLVPLSQQKKVLQICEAG